MDYWECLAFLCVFFAFIWSVCGGGYFSSHTKKEAVLHTKKQVVLQSLENENGNSRFLGRVSYDGADHLRGFRAFLEGFKEMPIVPWPFDFWDSKRGMRIATEVEQISTLEIYDHVVTVVRSRNAQSMAGEKSMAISESPTVKQSSDAGSSGDEGDQNAKEFPLISSLSMETVTCAPISASREQDSQEETSCLKLEPKHSIFLSHSSVQKPFVEQLCKDLEEQNHFAFFDQRSSCLPEGEKFSTLIIDAAQKCQVAVVVLSREYLSSKWPMLELVEFVRARKSKSNSLKLLPLFYKASVEDLSNESVQKQWMPIWMELVGGDTRVDLKEWVAAVQELRGVNGLRLDKFGNSEVSYRDAIRKAIFTLAPPNLLYDTSNIIGCNRVCKILEGMFLPDTRTCAQVLGLYGMGGLGKTTMSKSLCNYFIEQFSGRVCYIEINEEITKLERQKMVMRKLLSANESLLQDLSDVSKGWSLLKSRMKEHPVFLVIDNIQFDGASKEEAREYLKVKYNSGSKIMILSRSLDVVKDLLGESCYCRHIPRLKKDEAARVLLQQGAPLMDYSSLTGDERRVVDGCLAEACFSHQSLTQTILDCENHLYANVGGHYHPLALRALGVYLHDRSETSNVLSWNNHLSEYGKLKITMESYKGMFKILGLKFDTFDRTTKLMFLDICLYASLALMSPMLSNSPLEDLTVWLANVHEEQIKVVQSKILDFKRCAMINIEPGERIMVHDLYKEYATWFLGQVDHAEEVLGVWYVGKPGHLGSSLPLELQRTPSGKCWPDLQRIRLQNIRCGGFSVEKVKQWCNVVVLQIVECNYVATLNLQGLTCLRHIELKRLKRLKTLILTEDGSSSSIDVSQGTFREPVQDLLPPLQFVIVDGLSVLECLPSFSPFKLLKFLKVVNCEDLTQPPRVQHCSSVERILLSWYSNQKALPSLDGLTSLRDLTITNTGSEAYNGRALKLEGLSSLISLGSLELHKIPVADLSGLENLTRVEYISLSGCQYLTMQLHNLARSSLRVLEVQGYDKNVTVMMFKSMIELKHEKLATQGNFPSKILLEYPSPKVYFSHSGMQKDFVEQLCVDLERFDRYPYFGKQQSSLPIGENFPRLIFDAIQQCHVGVLILSKEFFTKSKWPMLELVAMVKELVREKSNSSMNIIPVFYNLSQEEWLDQENRSKWILLWKEWASEDERINIEEWKMALDALKSINSLMKKGGEVSLRSEIVNVVCNLVSPETRDKMG